MTHKNEFVVAIVGPTASGKSEIADVVAKQLNTDVVSADAMQVYRGMDIGTAKTPIDKRRVPLHCIDMVDVFEPYSVALYAKSAHACIDMLLDANGSCVVCGGTGLYVRAAMEDMDFPAGEQSKNPIREKYERIAHEKGAQAVYDILLQCDKQSAALIHPHNVRRVIRALELHEQGISYAREHKHLHERHDRHPSYYFAVDINREDLYARINMRVDDMFAAGLVEEVRGLLKLGIQTSSTASQAIGYKEVIEYLQGRTTYNEAIDNVKRASRRYAKRQMTWFRADKRIKWIPFNNDPDQVVKSILTTLHEGSQLAG